MKKLTIAIIIAFSATLFFTKASDTIKATNPLIEYTGRIDFSNPYAPKFSYSGVSIRASFQGSSVSIMLNDEDTLNNYNILVDNQIVKRIKVSKGLKTYPIATGLRDTVHEIEIFRLTELTFGKTAFNGLLVDNGKSLVAISNQRPYLIEYIGNSITCGYGNEGPNGAKFSAATENHYLTYAANTSRNFNARHLAVCRSGIGIYRNYGDAITGSAENMTTNYNRTFLFDANPKYNFALKPDLICVDLGTNDFSTTGGDSARYVKQFLSFVDTLQVRNKGTDILVLLGPMIGEPTLSNVRRYLKFVVDSASKMNKGKVYFFEMSAQSGDLGIGVDYHPTVAQHLRNSKELTKYISQIKAWKINPLLVNASIAKTNELVLSFNTPLIDTQNKFAGFKVTADTKSLGIQKVYADSSDASKLHIILSDLIGFNQKVAFSYTSGTISTSDNMKLGTIAAYPISNNLVETKLIEAYVEKNGKTIYLNFNKSIVKPQNVSDIKFTNSRNKAIMIDSFLLITKTSLQLFPSIQISKDDTVYVAVPSSIRAEDGVLVSPLTKYLLVNNSRITVSIGKSEASDIEIYPNPAMQQIIYYKVPTIENTMAEIFDMQGKLVFRQKLLLSQGQLDLSDLAKSNNYVLKISSNNQAFQKIIVL